MARKKAPEEGTEEEAAGDRTVDEEVVENKTVEEAIEEEVEMAPAVVAEPTRTAPSPPPTPSTDWGRVTERPVMAPPPPPPPAPPAPVSVAQPNPVVVDEATKPEPEQEVADEAQSGVRVRQTPTGRRPQAPGIIGGGVPGGVPSGGAGPPGRPG